MSRARPIHLPDGEKHWFDVRKNGRQATEAQLELLATIEEIDLDDLLDESLSQGDVLKHLREALDQGGIPCEVIERRRQWRAERQAQPRCRICGKEGDSTKHHFINKWILRELEHYAQKWADRGKSTAPICIHCHRDLHSRDESAKSIAPYLDVEERAFAQAALTALIEERPKIAWLITLGDDAVYETRLLRDFIDGRFSTGASG